MKRTLIMLGAALALLVAAYFYAPSICFGGICIKKAEKPLIGTYRSNEPLDTKKYGRANVYISNGENLK